MNETKQRRFRAIYVRPHGSREVVRYIVLDTTGLADADESARLQGHVDELTAAFPPDQYEIHDVGYYTERYTIGYDSIANQGHLTPTRQFIAIYVRRLQPRQIEHHLVFESTEMTLQDLSDRMARHLDELAKDYPADEYEVYYEGYRSLDAMRRAYPDLSIADLPAGPSSDGR